MTRPRAAQVSLADTPYYHCVAHCVRRAYLCGIDHLTGENYEHRRKWIVTKLKCYPPFSASTSAPMRR